MKVVLDTNILASGIFWSGVPLKILTLWKREKIQVLASEAILDEYLKTIGRIAQKLGRPGLHRAWALTLPSRVKLVAVRKSFRLCRDPKDDMFIDCAIAGKARYIVSGDRDLLVLNQTIAFGIVACARGFSSKTWAAPMLHNHPDHNYCLKHIEPAPKTAVAGMRRPEKHRLRIGISSTEV